MQTVDVPRAAWAKTLDEFSLVHEGWLVSIDVLDPSLGAQVEVESLPLAGLTVEPDDEGGRITIAVGRLPAAHVVRAIEHPSRLRIERSEQGADVALQIETREGTTTLVRFRTAALPETVDGVP